MGEGEGEGEGEGDDNIEGKCFCLSTPLRSRNVKVQESCRGESSRDETRLVVPLA